MPLFRKRAVRPERAVAPALAPTGHPGDDMLLAQIATHTDLSKSRHWVHYLYFPDRARAESAAEVISAAGWQIQHVDVAANGVPEWVVIAEATRPTTPEAVRDARLFFEGVAATHDGGEYDGWEASI